MKFADHLSKKDIQKFNQLRRANKKKETPEPKPKPKKKEELSQRDLEELMNIRRPTYRRKKGGAWSNG